MLQKIFDLPFKPCIAAQNFSTLVLFKAYNLIDKFGIICLSKTNLDSIILPDDSNLEIPGYNLVRCYHTSNNYKNYLPLRIIVINYLNECVKFELTVGEKFCYFITLYGSLSQSQDQFETFKENFKLNLKSAVQKNPFIDLALCDFNAKSSSCCKKDITTKGEAISSSD